MEDLGCFTWLLISTLFTHVITSEVTWIEELSKESGDERNGVSNKPTILAVVLLSRASQLESDASRSQDSIEDSSAERPYGVNNANNNYIDTDFSKRHDESGQYAKIIRSRNESNPLTETIQPIKHSSNIKRTQCDLTGDSSEGIPIARSMQKAFGKQGNKLCRKACSEALKNGCAMYECKRKMKKKIKKVCKRVCKDKFRTGKYSDKGSDSD